MSGKRELQKHLNKAKREHEESLSADNTADSMPISAKRQRKEPKDLVTGPSTAALTMSLSHTTNVPNTILPVYQHMLPNNPEGIAFLFGTCFSKALQVPAERVAIQYQITKEDAIEELRRLLIIKAFTADIDANKISPTPLMDELWHASILDTKLYAELQEALGLVLHHRPSGTSDQESERREKRLTVMKAIYRANFSTDPLERPPPSNQPSPAWPAPSEPHLYLCHDSDRK